MRKIKQLICFPIKLYQYLISPMLQQSCRFEPSCSNYALLAIEHHGILKGLLLTVWRLLRCNPWCVGGYDSVVPNPVDNLTDTERLPNGH